MTVSQVSWYALSDGVHFVDVFGTADFGALSNLQVGFIRLQRYSLC